jgi:hypothetical protein
LKDKPNAVGTEGELALPLRGKKSNLGADDFSSYLAGERLGLGTLIASRWRARIGITLSSS